MTVTSFGARAAPKMVRRLTEENGFRSWHLSYDVSALSEARFQKNVKSDEVLFARSIEPFEGGRWRLRRMRA